MVELMEVKVIAKACRKLIINVVIMVTNRFSSGFKISSTKSVFGIEEGFAVNLNLL